MSISWKQLFTNTILEKAKTTKSKITDIKHTNNTISAILKTNREFNVEIILEDDELLDANCSCSAKSHCIHEAKFLYFIEEFPEILEDHQQIYAPSESILNVNTDEMLKQVSITNLNKFIKKELRTNKKFKYDFIKYFQEQPLIDKELYKKNLKSIFSNGKIEGFRSHGFYNVDKLSRPLKSFMRTDIKKLIEMKEYKFATELLNSIMDTMHDEIYFDDRKFWDVIYYYQNYADILLYENIGKKEKEEMKKNLDRFNYFGF